MELILASNSPRRRELMGLLHIPFRVLPADIDEQMNPSADPCQEAARVSRCKALAVPRQPEDVVVAADTIVVCQGKILGKPRDAAEARRMLALLSGRGHQVITGLTVVRGDCILSQPQVTQVYFRDLTDGEIRQYVQSGEPMDKAGAYGIQGGAALFCTRIEGDYYNVVGLPVCALWQMLRSAAPELMEGTI